MTVLVGGVKAVRATARMPTHAMRLHDWGTRRLTSALSAQDVRVLTWAIQVGTSHVNNPLDCGRSCGVVRAVSSGHIVSGSRDHACSVGGKEHHYGRYICRLDPRHAQRGFCFERLFRGFFILLDIASRGLRPHFESLGIAFLMAR